MSRYMREPSARVSDLDFHSLRGVKERIDWSLMDGDHMFARDPAHYREVGESALRVIVAALISSNSSNPRAILDFGCGSGRVTRWLRAAFPAARIDVADVRDGALEFCARTFDASAWKTHANFEGLEAPGQYDLIWSGSLLTHLEEAGARTLLRKFESWLKPGGVCVVTTHGRRALSNMETGRLRYTSPDRESALFADYTQSGYAFAPYSGSPHLGVSFCSPAWLLEQVRSIDVRLVALSEAAWDLHQDVLAFQRYVAERRYSSW